MRKSADCEAVYPPQKWAAERRVLERVSFALPEQTRRSEAGGGSKVRSTEGNAASKKTIYTNTHGKRRTDQRRVCGDETDVC